MPKSKVRGVKSKLLELKEDLEKRLGVFQNRNFPFLSATKQKLLKYIQLTAHSQSLWAKWQTMKVRIQNNVFSVPNISFGR